MMKKMMIDIKIDANNHTQLGPWGVMLFLHVWQTFCILSNFEQLGSMAVQTN